MAKNVPIKVDSSIKTNTCRTCLNESDSLVPIFCKILICGDFIERKELLMGCASIQVRTYSIG